MTKPIHAIAVVIIAMIAVISAISIFMNSATPTQVAGQNDVEATVQTLNSAQHINMKKHIFSIRDKWTVQADGETVGTVYGENIKIIGDTYTFYSNNGYVVGRENENLHVVKRSAGVFDQNDQQIGYIEGDILQILLNFTLKKNETVEAKFQQKMNLTFKGEVTDANNKVAWVSAQNLVQTSTTLNMDRAEGDMETLDAIWLTLIASEVHDARNKK